MESRGFEKFAGGAAIAAGLSALLYAISFILIRDPLLSGLFLMLTGLLATPGLVALYARLARTQPAPALWALLMGTVATLGSAIHGAYDLAEATQPAPAAAQAAAANLPSQIDPRGLLTFGVMSIALFTFSALITRDPRLPRGLGWLGYALAALLAILYLGRLIILDATSPFILGPAVIVGFILSPAWYLWLGVSLALPALGPQTAQAGRARVR